MSIKFGREVCGNLEISEHREWLVTNGIGGYASGTVSGLLTRCYHGLLLATLKPPLGITLLLTKLDETVVYGDVAYPLHTNRWADGTIAPHGYQQLERFYLEGTTPVWVYACGDALIEKRVWMQQQENTTYIQYKMLRGSQLLTLSLKALVNYRDRHSSTRNSDRPYEIVNQQQGIKIKAFADATSLYLSSVKNQEVIAWQINHVWYKNFALAVEKYRGLNSIEDHLYAGNCRVSLQSEESVTIVASTKDGDNRERDAEKKGKREQKLIALFSDRHQPKVIPSWIQQLVVAADQFIVDRPIADVPQGKTIIAGYPWFGDWGRDTMISLPGLTLTTGRFEVAKVILRTFAKYIDRGMLPNVFPDRGETPEYNTVDASLWFFEAIRDYLAHTGDKRLLIELFPALVEIIDWHRRGTRYNIHLDSDGLIYAGEKGVQLTWMDAKVGNWVVTPRIGKPVEINALWYNALIIMSQFASYLGKSEKEYLEMAAKTREGFQRFWHPDLQYCYDVLDTPAGNDDSLRPNQIFAVSLPAMSIGKNLSLGASLAPLLDDRQQKQVVDLVSRRLLTSYGLRSLCPNHPDYVGIYGGDRLQRDRAYHQGTVWGWLIGHFVQAHLKVYQNPEVCKSFLEPMSEHLAAACVGSLSEIFDADAPFTPRGAFAQAWTVAEVLRGWLMANC
ncbi:MAG TPA: amylo-alpha-1,6-glucosidase [Coleofasciculaceae cyanobacterium]|jgi:predicted glycogen debranching enzyme